MWITVLFDTLNGDAEDKPKVIYSDSKNIYNGDVTTTYRTSQLFPVHADTKLDIGNNYYIFFYNYDNPYLQLGKIINNSEELRSRTWYNIGLSSIVLITINPKLNEDLQRLLNAELRTIEQWEIANEFVENGDHKVFTKPDIDVNKCRIVDYENLPLIESSVVDEFAANINIIIPKIAIHNPSQLNVYYLLIEDVNELISDLEYIKTCKGDVPKTLQEYSKDQLQKDSSLREMIMHQNIERIIQINSALAYISTQSLSGAVPILERRSLIRRHSLLGIGTAAMALNRIAGSIESAFKSCSLEYILLDRMVDTECLPGVDDLLDYDFTEWKNYSLARWDSNGHNVRPSTKIPYFSGRLGFRETEYTISAAIQCITSGSNLSWNLITLTHEMLHSHVRELISKIFHGKNENNEFKNFEEFYDKFEKHIFKEDVNLNLLDSIRNLIFTYVCQTCYNGSITKEPVSIKSFKSENGGQEVSTEFYLPDKESLLERFQQEHRNINEIMVHVLDFHYFYESKLDIFVPLVWKSWASLPYISGDLKQYILRTLLVVSSEFKNNYISKRFENSVSRMIEILSSHKEKILNHSVIHRTISMLEDKQFIDKILPPFISSLRLVDLAENVFLSSKIRRVLLDDEFVEEIENEETLEGKYIYNLPEDFQEAYIERPAAFLLDRYVKQLTTPINDEHIESITARYFLACNTYKH